MHSSPRCTVSFVVWSFLAFKAIAQTTSSTPVVNATCGSAFEWMNNDQQQSPCVVAAALTGACQAEPATYPPIPPNNHYLGPTFAAITPCLCSSVTYSLISACDACQTRDWEDWTNWTLNCVEVSVTTFPKPLPVDVPAWAYLNVTAMGNDFNLVAAQQNATAPPPSSSTASSTTTSPVSTIASVTSSNSAAADTAQGSGKKTNAGAIAGGVVGGLSLLVIIGLAWFWFQTRRQQTNQVYEASSFRKESMVRERDPSGSTVPSPYIIYNTSDAPMSQSLKSPAPSTMYTSYGGRNSMETLPHAPVHYGGAPEI